MREISAKHRWWMPALLILPLTFMGARTGLAQAAAPDAGTSPDSGLQAVIPGPAVDKASLAIGHGDLVEVSVFEEPQLTQRVRVDADGRITLSLLGEVLVSGMVPADAANVIAEKYRSARLLNRPRVAVLVLEYATQSTIVLGQVVHPGAILLYAPRGVLDVLSMAGGFTEIADRHITIQRHSGAAETVYLPNGAGAMLEQSSVQVNPGDSVIVPRAGIVYVLGDVARPGGYVMQNDAGMTLLQAIASASGINKTAAEAQTRLIRTLSNGDFQELKVGLKRIERGKEADIPLQANDVVYVPFSVARNVILGAPAILSATAAAAIYAHP